MKPMLAATVDKVEDLEFPFMASPKLDGIRAIVKDGVLLSRNFKMIPNKFIQKHFGKDKFNGLDGELIIGNPTDPDAFRRTTSGVMSQEGDPLGVRFHVFDNFLSKEPFFKRFDSLSQWDGLHKILVVPHVVVTKPESLLELEVNWLDKGFEGVMLRDLHGSYKYGRSTLRERGLLKLKRFADAEAQVIGFEEQMENTNEATKDALGKTKRSNHKSGMKGKDTLGALKVIGINGEYKGVTFYIGSGMDDFLRHHIWMRQEEHHAKIVKYKYFPSGSKDAPRFPTFLGFREDL